MTGVGHCVVVGDPDVSVGVGQDVDGDGVTGGGEVVGDQVTGARVIEVVITLIVNGMGNLVVWARPISLPSTIVSPYDVTL